MSNPLRPVFFVRGLPCVVWCFDCQGAGTPCLTRGRAFRGHGGGGAMAPAPFLESRLQTHPHMPGFLLWDAAGIGCGSIWCVPLLEVAPVVGLPLPLGCLACEVC